MFFIIEFSRLCFGVCHSYTEINDTLCGMDIVILLSGIVMNSIFIIKLGDLACRRKPLTFCLILDLVSICLSIALNYLVMN